MKMNIPTAIESDINFDGSLDSAIELLNYFKSNYSSYKNLRFELESSYDGGHYVNLLGDRVETDEEYSDRIQREERNKKSY